MLIVELFIVQHVIHVFGLLASVFEEVEKKVDIHVKYRALLEVLFSQRLSCDKIGFASLLLPPPRLRILLASPQWTSSNEQVATIHGRNGDGDGEGTINIVAQS